MRTRLNENGISVVELLVGVVLLAVVVVSLAASGLYASRAMGRSRIQLEATEFVQAELERLLGVPYFELESGSRSSDGGKSEWTVTAEGISVTDTVVAYRLRP
jgi:Tfp pilus assembly protein PilV